MGLTSLGGSEVFAGGGSARTATARLLDAESAALDDLTLKAFLGGIGLLSGAHVDESKSTRFLGVRVQHDGAARDITVLLEKARNIGFGETRVDTSHEKVGSGILGTFLILFLNQMGLAQGTRTAVSN